MRRAFLLLLIMMTVTQLFADDPDCQLSKYNDVDWSDQQYKSALQQLMPIYEPGSWAGIDLVLNVKILPSFSPEFGFTLIRHTNGSVDGYAVFTEDGSIYE